MEDSKGIISSRYNRTEGHKRKNSEAAHVKVRQGPSGDRGKSEQAPTPNQGAICYRHLLIKEKLVFPVEYSWIC